MVTSENGEVDLRTAIELVRKAEHGTKESLEKLIGNSRYRQFYLMGIIKLGVGLNDSSSVSTWHISSLGLKMSDFYRTPNDSEKQMGLYCDSIGF